MRPGGVPPLLSWQPMGRHTRSTTRAFASRHTSTTPRLSPQYGMTDKGYIPLVSWVAVSWAVALASCSCVRRAVRQAAYVTALSLAVPQEHVAKVHKPPTPHEILMTCGNTNGTDLVRRPARPAGDCLHRLSLLRIRQPVLTSP